MSEKEDAPASVLTELSVAAVKKRINRLMTPKADGSFKVPKEIRDDWLSNSGQTQDKMIREFKRSGGDKDFVILQRKMSR